MILNIVVFGFFFVTSLLTMVDAFSAKSCAGLCGFYRVLYPEDTCQCDAACQAANDCCWDFATMCPEFAKNEDNRKTKCHGYNLPEFPASAFDYRNEMDSEYGNERPAVYDKGWGDRFGNGLTGGPPNGRRGGLDHGLPGEFGNRLPDGYPSLERVIGVQTVISCPEGSNALTSSKCSAATSGRNRANVNSDELYLYIPVTANDNVTYANSFCARCHGESTFDFWNVDISNVSDCLRRILEKDKDFKKAQCQMEGDITPLAPKKLINWLQSYEGISTSRFSKYCLRDDYFLACDFASEANASCTEIEDTTGINARTNTECAQNAAKAKSCHNGKMSHYLICNWPVLTNCLHCNVNQSCLKEFSMEDFHTIYGNKIYRDLFGRLSLIMIVESPLIIRLEFMEDLLLTQNCSNLIVCKGANESECSSYSGNPEPLCIHPNPFTRKCLAFDCNENVSVRMNGSVNYSYWEFALTEFMLLLSVISLVITILLLLLIPELQSNFTYYQINCYFTYLLGNIFLFVSAIVSSVKALCILSAIFLHFALLSSFSWMLVTGSFILNTFHSLNHQIGNAGANANSLADRNKHVVAHFVGHLVPAILVISCVIFDTCLIPGVIGYGQGEFCWISSGEALLITYVVPSGLLLILNLIIFLGCFLFLVCFRCQNQLATISSNGFMFLVLMKLLIGSGVQWLFGVAIHLSPQNVVVRYMFIVLVSSHGIFILVCTLSQRVMRRKVSSLVLSMHDKFSNSKGVVALIQDPNASKTFNTPNDGADHNGEAATNA